MALDIHLLNAETDPRAQREVNHESRHVHQWGEDGGEGEVGGRWLVKPNPQPHV